MKPQVSNRILPINQGRMDGPRTESQYGCAGSPGAHAGENRGSEFSPLHRSGGAHIVCSGENQLIRSRVRPGSRELPDALTDWYSRKRRGKEQRRDIVRCIRRY